MASLHDTEEIGGIAVADRPVARWIVALGFVVFGWVLYYMITFGMQNAGTFPRPADAPARPATSGQGH